MVRHLFFAALSARSITGIVLATSAVMMLCANSPNKILRQSISSSSGKAYAESDTIESATAVLEILKKELNSCQSKPEMDCSDIKDGISIVRSNIDRNNGAPQATFSAKGLFEIGRFKEIYIRLVEAGKRNTVPGGVALLQYATRLFWLNRCNEAEPLLENGKNILIETGGRIDDVTNALDMLASCRNNAGDFGRAENFLRQELEIIRQYDASFEEDVVLKLADNLVLQDRLVDAEKLISPYAESTKPCTGDPGTKPTKLLARILEQAGNSDKAREILLCIYDRALAEDKFIIRGSDYPQEIDAPYFMAGQAATNLALNIEDKGDLVAAETLLKRSIKPIDVFYPVADLRHAITIYRYAENSARRMDFSVASSMYSQALTELDEQKSGSNEWKVRVRSRFAIMQLNRGDPHAALELLGPASLLLIKEFRSRPAEKPETYHFLSQFSVVFRAQLRAEWELSDREVAEH